jgi:hypothetical protein
VSPRQRRSSNRRNLDLERSKTLRKSSLLRNRSLRAGEKTLVRDRRLGVRRVGRVLLDAADEIERSVQRLVILRIWWDVGLRASLLVARGLEVAAQRSLARSCRCAL